MGENILLARWLSLAGWRRKIFRARRAAADERREEEEKKPLSNRNITIV